MSRNIYVVKGRKTLQFPYDLETWKKRQAHRSENPPASAMGSVKVYALHS